jgi:hypothetical protein
MYNSIIERKKTLRLIRNSNLLKFNKEEILGEGYQGTVYKKCNNTFCIATKKIYLSKVESKYTENFYKKAALKYSSYIELASGYLTNELILNNISPNFLLSYNYNIIDREGFVCDNKYPSKLLLHNEFANNTETFTKWVQESRETKYFNNAYFQIVYSLYVLQKYFGMSHVDLHSDNILVQKITPGGYWEYKIKGKKYYVPNLGYIFYIIDFGQAWIPQKFQSWYITQKYNEKQITKTIDLQILFKSTLKISKSPNSFKEEIKNIIKLLKKPSYKFSELIELIWYDQYKYKYITNNQRVLDSFNSEKLITHKNLPDYLQDFVKPSVRLNI